MLCTSAYRPGVDFPEEAPSGHLPPPDTLSLAGCRGPGCRAGRDDGRRPVAPLRRQPAQRTNNFTSAWAVCSASASRLRCSCRTGTALQTRPLGLSHSGRCSGEQGTSHRQRQVSQCLQPPASGAKDEKESRRRRHSEPGIGDARSRYTTGRCVQAARNHPAKYLEVALGVRMRARGDRDGR